MSSNLSPEQFPETLYRGLHFGHLTDEEAEQHLADPHKFIKQSLNQRELGVHWTQSPSSAENFAQDRDPEGWAHEGDPFDDEDEAEHRQPFGVVLEAGVHPSHILQPDTEEWEGYSMSDAILDPDHLEQESTVRGGAPLTSRKAHFMHGARMKSVDVPGRFWHA